MTFGGGVKDIRGFSPKKDSSDEMYHSTSCVGRNLRVFMSVYYNRVRRGDSAFDHVP